MRNNIKEKISDQIYKFEHQVASKIGHELESNQILAQCLNRIDVKIRIQIWDRVGRLIKEQMNEKH